jgi:hypothetical protein
VYIERHINTCKRARERGSERERVEERRERRERGEREERKRRERGERESARGGGRERQKERERERLDLAVGCERMEPWCAGCLYSVQKLTKVSIHS